MLPLHTANLPKQDDRRSAKRRPAVALLVSVTLHLLIALALLLIPRPDPPLKNAPTTPQFTLHFSSDQDLLATSPAAPPQNNTQTPSQILPPRQHAAPAPLSPSIFPALPALTISATFATNENVATTIELTSTSIDFPRPKAQPSTLPQHKSSASSATTGKLAAARPSKRRAPIYPKIARKKGYQGTSVFIATINPDGSIKELKLSKTSGHAILDRAAKEALRHWKFTPAKRNGITIASQLRIPIIFRLG
ncbi:MAG: energy transducer TonB [Verrucomicrobiota bacterium]